MLEALVIAGLVAAPLGSAALFLPRRRRYRAGTLLAVYLVCASEWTFASDLGPASTIGGVLLWCLEVIAAAMSCAYLWELCDALGTEHWRRRRPALDPHHRVPTE